MKLFALAAAAALLISTAAVAEPYQAVTSHNVSTSTTEATTSRVTQTGIAALRIVMTAAGYVAVMTTPFTSAASAPVFVPANVPVTLKAKGSQVVGVILDTSSGNLHVTELSK